MPNKFHRLPVRSLAVDTVVLRSRQGLPESVTMEDPATNVMTDLTRVKVFTISPDTTIDDALQKMIHAEVRLLIVTGAGDNVLGVISAYDIMGERPIGIGTALGIPRSTIQVKQLMTPRDEIEALRMIDVEDARVGDIVATLRGAGRQHAIVVDRDRPGNEILRPPRMSWNSRDIWHEHAVVLRRRPGQEILRGIFSLTQIARQLGMAIEPDGKAQSFAELERALASA